VDALLVSLYGAAVSLGSCAAGTALWDELIAVAWAALPALGTPDLMLASEAPLVDTNADQLADSLGTTAAPGLWLMKVALGGSWTSPASATYVGLPDLVIPLH
jgi:hypothetical protein